VYLQQHIRPVCAVAARLAHKKYGRAVAVLIDEYDKPILDNITDYDTALLMREGLKNFYSVIKSADADIHFAFMTGVSKFSQVSLFSGLNNLNDITLDARYSSLCGYTDADVDVDSVFGPELAGLDREEIRLWYNGYNWLGQAVYNPFDLLLLFDKRKFDAYWFESATPSFLIKLLTEREAWLPALDNTVADAQLLAADMEEIPTTALLFQAGYLTIEREEEVGGHYCYHLGIPNKNVRQSLHGGLLRACPSR
jgi:Predicted AAA-ATPase